MSIHTKLNRRSFMMTGAAVAGSFALAPRSALAAKYQIDLALNGGTTEQAFAALFTSRGITDKWDVSFNPTPISDGTKIIASILSGTSAMCPASGYSNILVAIEKGADLKLVCGGSTKVANAVFSWRDDVQSIADLSGKTVAVGAPGSLLHQFMIVLLKKHGVDPKSVSFVNAGSSVNCYRAVAGKTVDVAPGLLNAIPIAGQSGLHIIAKVWEELPNFPYQAGYASTKAIAEQREAIIRTICAYGDLYNFIQSDALDAKQAFVDAFTAATKVDPDAAALQWEFAYENKAYGINLTAEQINYLQDLNLEAGLQKTKLPLEKVADLSVLDEARKRLGMG